MNARKQATWFGVANLSLAAGMVALYQVLLPVLRVGGGCMSGLGAILVLGTVVLTTSICGIALLRSPRAGGALCLVVGSVSAAWASLALVQWASSAAHESGSVAVRLLQSGIVLLIPLQLVPGLLVHRAGAAGVRLER